MREEGTVSEDVLYTTKWNDLTRRPIAGHRWLSTQEAQAAWDAGAAVGIEAVDAAHRDPDGVPLPRWVLGGAATGGIRVQFFTPGGSIHRSTDFDDRDGRLWRWISVNYIYPDQTNRYFEPDCLEMITEEFNPDGTGRISYDIKTEPTVTVHNLTGAPVHGFWLDRPPFGHWTDLTNPDYGIPPP